MNEAKMTVSGATERVMDGARGFVVPLGRANLVLAVTASGGVLACGAVDPAPLASLGIAAARVRPTRGPSVVDLDDLLVAEVREANALAEARGVRAGQPAAEALRRL